ncbi:MAG TPA: hypothetical protein VIL38_04070 [Thermaerobacter sp.]
MDGANRSQPDPTGPAFTGPVPASAAEAAPTPATAPAATAGPTRAASSSAAGAPSPGPAPSPAPGSAAATAPATALATAPATATPGGEPAARAGGGGQTGEAPRLLELPPARLVELRGMALRQAIAASEGRVLVAEMVAEAPPLVDGVTNGELAAAFGADLLLVNVYDVTRPRITGLPGWDENGAAPLAALARLAGRVVGINLEPSERVPPGRRATPENALQAVEQGARWILLTGNPHTGVTVRGILEAARAIRRVLDRDRLLLAAGRMHGAGAWYGQEPFLDEAALGELVAAGVDVVALPAPATVPGVTVEQARRWVEAVHAAGALAMSTVGTSQEGADQETIREIALMAKACGFDLHHLGDAGYHGVAVPENLLAYGLAIRGRRHTYRRMALSAWRA